MDEQRFDLLARALATSRTRRQTVAFLAAAAGIGFQPLRTLAAQDAAACDPGLTYCVEADACVDLLTDLDHCGACGSVCASELVSVACRGGECVRANCPEGVEYCGIVDGCRDLATDPAHCGACGNACASGVCSNGVCAPSGDGCPEGDVDCDGVCVATCCNNDHCGACGNACTGGRTCFEGVCDCPSGDCPPVTLPNTGSGSMDRSPVEPPWAALAAAGAAAAATVGWSRRDRQPTTPKEVGR